MPSPSSGSDDDYGYAPGYDVVPPSITSSPEYTDSNNDGYAPTDGGNYYAAPPAAAQTDDGYLRTEDKGLDKQMATPLGKHR
eukprot:scaffold307646_cov25-Prasinocladus_malaysianus.AAC.1